MKLLEEHASLRLWYQRPEGSKHQSSPRRGVRGPPSISSGFDRTGRVGVGSSLLFTLPPQRRREWATGAGNSARGEGTNERCTFCLIKHYQIIPRQRGGSSKPPPNPLPGFGDVTAVNAARRERICRIHLIPTAATLTNCLLTAAKSPELMTRSQKQTVINLFT